VESWNNGHSWDDIPPYLDDRPPAVQREVPLVLKDLYERYRQGAKSNQTQLGKQLQARNHEGASPLFARMVPLPPGQVMSALDAWWRSESSAGVVTVRRRLEFGPLQGDTATGWRVTGRMRRTTRLHWVPVLLELHSNYAYCTRITMVPQTRVFVTRRYFRAGNSALDQFLVELAVHH
jgi:hypothetical protein